MIKIFRKRFARMKNIERAIQIKSNRMITSHDYAFLKNFIKDYNANNNKKELITEVKVLLEYFTWFESNQKMLSHIQVPENVKEIINDPTGKMCNFDSFLLSFNNMYIQNPDFRNSLIIGLCKGIVSKLHGRMNPQWTSRVLDFSNVIRLKSPSAYRFIADNLLSPSIRHLGRITSNIDHDSIFNIEKSAIIKRVDIWVNSVLDECSDSKLICSLSGDATKVAKMYQ